MKVIKKKFEPCLLPWLSSNKQGSAPIPVPPVITLSIINHPLSPIVAHCQSWKTHCHRLTHCQSSIPNFSHLLPTIYCQWPSAEASAVKSFALKSESPSFQSPIISADNFHLCFFATCAFCSPVFFTTCAFLQSVLFSTCAFLQSSQSGKTEGGGALLPAWLATHLFISIFLSKK